MAFTKYKRQIHAFPCTCSQKRIAKAINSLLNRKKTEIILETIFLKNNPYIYSQAVSFINTQADSFSSSNSY